MLPYSNEESFRRFVMYITSHKAIIKRKVRR